MQAVARRSTMKRVQAAVGRTLAATALVCLMGGVGYAAFSYQTWQWEWATGCQPDHAGLSKAEWIFGVRPFNDCRPWWARWIFRDA